MSIIKEFKEFAVKGNVIDMAVGIIIGAAFGKIVSSLVADVVTPPIGFLLGGVDFSNLAITLKAAADESSGSRPQLWQVYSDSLRFHDRGCCYFYDDQGDQYAEEEGEGSPGGPAGTEQGRATADRDP